MITPAWATNQDPVSLFFKKERTFRRNFSGSATEEGMLFSRDLYAFYIL